MSQSIKATIAGSHPLYEIDIFPLCTRFREGIRGVCVLFQEIADREYVPVRIESTESVQEWLCRADFEPSLKEMGVTHVGVIAVSEGALMKTIWEDLRFAYDPLYNRIEATITLPGSW